MSSENFQQSGTMNGSEENLNNLVDFTRLLFNAPRQLPRRPDRTRHEVINLQTLEPLPTFPEYERRPRQLAPAVNAPTFRCFARVSTTRATREEVSEGLQCSVCLENFEIFESLCRLQCHHSFHRQCLQSWVRRNPSCPMCRQEVQPTHARIAQ